MSHVDIKPGTGTFVRSMCALTTAALIWSQAAQVQAEGDKTVIDKLPPEIKLIAKNAQHIAAVYSGISGTIDAANAIGVMLGIVEKFDHAEEFRKLHEHLDLLGAALDWKLNVNNQDELLSKVLATVDTIEPAVKLGMPFNLATDGVLGSLEAVYEAGSENQFLRYYKASDTDGFWKKVIPDRPAVNPYNYVYDWRLGVPALMQLISLRLIIDAAIDPNFTKDMAFKSQLLRHRSNLLAQYNKMSDGVRCSSLYDYVEQFSDLDERYPSKPPESRYYNYYSVACADIYTGTSAFSPRRLWSISNSPYHKPSDRNPSVSDPYFQQFVSTTVKPTEEALYRQVILMLPLFEMRSMIDTRYLYANGGPDLTKAQELIQVAAAPNLCLDVQWGNPTPGTPVWLWGCDGDHAQRWVYKRHAENVEERGTIRNPVYNKCLDVQWGNPAPGTPVQIWDCNGGLAQKWTWDPETQVLQNALGTVLSTQCQIQFRVQRQHWGIPLPAFECGPPQAQTPVWTWGRNEGPAQRWKTPRSFNSLWDGLLDQVDAPLHKGEWPRRIGE